MEGSALHELAYYSSRDSLPSLGLIKVDRAPLLVVIMGTVLQSTRSVEITTR